MIRLGIVLIWRWASFVAQLVKNLPAMQGKEDPPGEGKGYPLQYSGLENSKDCIVCGVAKSRTRLNDSHITLYILHESLQ